MVASKDQYQRAIDKATAQGTVKTVQYHGAGSYTVSGARGVRYHVGRQFDGSLRCTCPAGQVASPCYHAAAVWLRLKGEQMCRTQAAAAISVVAAPASRPSLRRNLMDDAERALVTEIYGPRQLAPAREEWV